MALDVHEYENRRMGRLLLQIDDNASAAAYPAFELFRQRTGKFIDPYRDTAIDQDMGALTTALKDAGVAPVLLDLLTRCFREKVAIIFVGD